ncbi:MULTISPECIES: GntR family transcriptional regulator [Asticcacaulis]|uniref:GntR family transcriptional regulator n=1 Tax=Asticcacaulis TaxID=76890 RepID=UPI001AE2A14F|nr:MULTISPECIES: GntR family transcriptional regulator [Asticcacaulis]MBP2157904.1 GntR family transcriptional regulator [Asticcacaulis solisilvae]MDR6798949.1 GntR family transcriptional regulator [Asticcacaulis sp. BE141]
MSSTKRAPAESGAKAASLYLQLQDTLRDAITSRRLAPDAAIPTERELAEEFKVSRITVRKAVDGLVYEGLLTRRQGAGTFVNKRVEKSYSKMSSFTEDMISRGRVPSSKWLSKSAGLVNPEEALAMGLSPGTTVFRFNRMRFADGTSMGLDYATVPANCLPSLDAVTNSLYEALEAAGTRPVRALQRLRAVAFNAEQAQLLEIPVGSPGLLIERRGFLADGRPAEYTQSYYRGDAYDLMSELSHIA